MIVWGRTFVLVNASVERMTVDHVVSFRERTCMAQWNIAEAKAHFSEILRRALQGEDVVIAKDNNPLIRLVPVQRPQGERVPGSAKNQILYITPYFDETPEDFVGVT